MLKRLGFTPCADEAALQTIPRLIMVGWTSHDTEATLAPDQFETAAGSMRFVVVQADVSTSTRITLARQFDNILTAPVDEIALCNALSTQRYVGLEPGERQSLRAKVLELACGDESAVGHLLRLIVDTNRSALATLRDSYEAQLWDQMGSAAHQIAGSARMLDCGGLIALLTRLEAAAREREIELLKALVPLVATTLESLELSVREALCPVG
ncbi:Hpt domain-containing protein [Paraburkholderia domus]|nr:Hpt domain-containing protein [Paraburkholderia domus]